MKSFKL